MGVTRVIKLNTEAESSDIAAEALGMTLIYKPIDIAEQIFFRPRYADVLSAVEAMQPYTLIHCEHGQDRTGLVVGCYRVWHDGWTKEEDESEMLSNGFHTELLGLTLFWEWTI